MAYRVKLETISLVENSETNATGRVVPVTYQPDLTARARGADVGVSLFLKEPQRVP